MKLFNHSPLSLQNAKRRVVDLAITLYQAKLNHLIATEKANRDRRAFINKFYSWLEKEEDMDASENQEKRTYNRKLLLKHFTSEEALKAEIRSLSFKIPKKYRRYLLEVLPKIRNFNEPGTIDHQVLYTDFFIQTHDFNAAYNAAIDENALFELESQFKDALSRLNLLNKFKSIAESFSPEELAMRFDFVENNTSTTSLHN